jgi:hypothetical protein
MNVSGYTAAGSASYTVAARGGPGAPGGFSDDFQRPDSDTLGNGWTKVSGDLEIQGGHLRNAAVRALHTAVVPAVSGAHQEVSGTFAVSDKNGGPRMGVILRYQSPGNYYLCYRQAGSSSVLRISRYSNGTEKVLRSVSVSNPQVDTPWTITCTVDGNTLSLEFNAKSRVTVTDTTYTSGSVGISMGYAKVSGAASSQRADSFTANVQ